MKSSPMVFDRAFMYTYEYIFIYINMPKLNENEEINERG